MILIIGATGTIGREVVKGLKAKGEQVRAMIRDPKKTTAAREPGVEYVTGDLADPDSVVAALQGIDKAFLLSPEGPDMAELHAKFAAAAKDAGVRHLVRASILPANPDAPIPLVKWHGEADRSLMESGVPYTILRPSYYMQNTLGGAATVASDGALYSAMGDGKIGHIDTRDIADVAVAVLTSEGHEGQSYLLTGPEALSMAELAARLSAVIGKKIEYVNLPPDEVKARLMAAGTLDWRADAWVKLAGMMSLGIAAMVTPAVNDVLGRDPRTIDQFASDFAAALKTG